LHHGAAAGRYRPCRAAAAYARYKDWPQRESNDHKSDQRPEPLEQAWAVQRSTKHPIYHWKHQHSLKPERRLGALLTYDRQGATPPWAAEDPAVSIWICHG
jgi:hypothetical protein